MSTFGTLIESTRLLICVWSSENVVGKFRPVVWLNFCTSGPSTYLPSNPPQLQSALELEIPISEQRPGIVGPVMGGTAQQTPLMTTVPTHTGSTQVPGTPQQSPKAVCQGGVV